MLPRKLRVKKKVNATVPLSSLSLGLCSTRFTHIFKTTKESKLCLWMSKADLPLRSLQPERWQDVAVGDGQR